MHKAGLDFFRDVRRDGNSFYRAVAVGFITNLTMYRNSKALLELAAMYFVKLLL